MNTPNKTPRFRHFVDNRSHPWQCWVVAALCFEVFRRTLGWLNGLYEQTRFPASVMEGQTTFSGEKVKYFYSVLIEHGTMDSFVRVQILDFAFMLTMFFAMLSLSVASYRSLPDKKRLKNVAWTMVFVLPLAPLFDALENLVSFVMLANPTDFADWLAIIHSSFAIIKFCLTGFGYIWSMSVAVITLIIFFYALTKRAMGKLV